MELPDSLKIEPLGERAFILRDWGSPPAFAISRALSKQEGVLEATPAYESVGLYLQAPLAIAEVRALLAAAKLPSMAEGKRLEIPVCYSMGPDLKEAAQILGLSTDELIERHASVNYTCHAIGFSPGFPYLGYLPESLCGVPRRASPRTRVEPGSVGITGNQTGIYPCVTPGGWALIGRTPLCLVDLAHTYFPLAAGDRVRFVPIDESEFHAREGERL